MEYSEATENLYSTLLQLHVEWHERRQHQSIRLSPFLQQIRDRFSAKLAQFYYKLALADQLAASLTRVQRLPTYSRYIVGQRRLEKIPFLELTKTLFAIPSLFRLWKYIIASPELVSLNESFAYGDQPLATHLLLTCAFGAHLLGGKPGYVYAKVVPRRQKRYIRGYWYKIFTITQAKEVVLHVIEPCIPDYPAAMVRKVLVKSLRPETCWLRIQ